MKEEDFILNCVSNIFLAVTLIIVTLIISNSTEWYLVGFIAVVALSVNAGFSIGRDYQKLQK